MNLEQAKIKLADISKSTATKHSKVLIGELCTIVSFLLTEIERINTPTFTVLTQKLPDKTKPLRRPSVLPDQDTPMFS